MEFSVRYVRLDDESGERPVLGLRGKKNAYCVVNDLNRIHVVSVPVKDFDKASVTMLHGDPYPVTRYLEEIEKYKKRKRISTKADHIVSLAYAGKPEAIDEEELAALPEDIPADDVPDPDIVHPARAAEPAGTRAKMTEEEFYRLFSPPAVPVKRPGKAKIDPPRRVPPGRTAKASVLTPPKRGRGRPPGGGAGVIAQCAGELKVEAAALRKACRAAGMRAPYTEAKAIKAAWAKHGKV